MQASNIVHGDLGSEGVYHTPKMPTPSMFQKLKDYHVDIVNGKVYRLKDDREVGHPHSGNYYTVNVCGRQLKRANIVWWAATGEWPTMLLDHKDRNRQNDRLDNLEPKDHDGNMKNRTVPVRDLPHGVYFISKSPHKPYMVIVTFSNVREYLGCFATPEEASLVFQVRRKELENA